MTCHVEREETSNVSIIGALKSMKFTCDFTGGCKAEVLDKDIPMQGGLGAMGWEASGGRHYCPQHRQRPLPGVNAIASERRRQIEIEGWTPEHDDAYHEDELARAAACYALGQCPRGVWPWPDKWWKPGDPVRNLEKAGALIAAEIDRRTRMEKKNG